MRYSHLFFLNMFMLSAYFQQADLLLFIIWLFSITPVSDECLGSASFGKVFFVAKLQLCSWKNDEKLESPTLSVIWMNFVTCTPSEFLNNPVFALYDNLALLIFTPKLALSEYYSPKLLKGICNIVSNLLYNLLLQLSCRSGQLTQDAVSNSISLKFVCFYIRMFFFKWSYSIHCKGMLPETVHIGSIFTFAEARPPLIGSKGMTHGSEVEPTVVSRYTIADEQEENLKTKY